MLRTTTALVVCLAFVSCSGTERVSRTDLALAAREAGVRCLVVEDDVTVVSPFDAGYTESLVEKTRASLHAIEAFLEVDVPSSLVVRFEALEMPGIKMTQNADGTFDVEGMGPLGRHGVAGYANAARSVPEVVIFVAPEAEVTTADGRADTARLFFDSNDRTILHELTHVAAKVAGLDGPTWFDEGIAEEVEWRELASDGRLVASPLPLPLRLARDGHDPYSIDDVLGWSEQGARVVAGEEEVFRLGRPLSNALVRFLLERVDGDGTRAKLERIVAMDEGELRAYGDEWKAWLAALPEDG